MARRYSPEEKLLYVAGATFALTLTMFVALMWVGSFAVSGAETISALYHSDLGLMFEHELPREALLKVQDIYAGAVAAAPRVHHVDPITGQFLQTGWDVSTNFEFTIIWNKLRERGFFKAESKIRQQYSKLVVDVGAMYVELRELEMGLGGKSPCGDSGETLREPVWRCFVGTSPP
jgi:hypothetical protein